MEGGNKILSVFEEIDHNGFSSRPPFCIGGRDKRIVLFSVENGVKVAPGGLYTNAKALAHMTRAIKQKNGIAASNQAISYFPIRRKTMDLYFDKYANLFVYVDESSKTKYVVHPNYKLRIRKKNVCKQFFLTTSRLKSTENFTNDKRRYVQINKKRGAGD